MMMMMMMTIIKKTHNNHISTITVPIVTEVGRMMTFLEGAPPHKVT